MDFYEVVDKVVDLLRRRKRVTYRSLKAQFQIDDEQLETVREEILYTHESSVQADERGFTWTGATEESQVATSQPDQAESQSTTQKESPIQLKPLPPEPPTPRS